MCSFLVILIIIRCHPNSILLQLHLSVCTIQLFLYWYSLSAFTFFTWITSALYHPAYCCKVRIIYIILVSCPAPFICTREKGSHLRIQLECNNWKFRCAYKPPLPYCVPRPSARAYVHTYIRITHNYIPLISCDHGSATWLGRNIRTLRIRPFLVLAHARRGLGTRLIYSGEKTTHIFIRNTYTYNHAPQ